uniref:Ig-like domain-containing protein n=1 Tax=Neogobius melanostomus TaxID=47308 RepID=A0A8C6TU30_9GOBI
MRGTSVCLLLLLLLLLGATEGFPNYSLEFCNFNSTDPNDIEYTMSYVYHNVEFVKFSSKWDKYVGLTEFGIEQAAKWNNDSRILNRRRLQKYVFCEPNVKLFYNNFLSKSVEPSAVLNTSPSGGSEQVLVCSVYGFFPKDVTVTWTNHQQPVTTGVSTTELLPDSGWTYQLHSHLEFSPSPGDQISCVIEHISLKEPIVLDYEGALSDGDRNKVAVGASGLVLGLVLSLAGFIYYRHKSRGLVLVPNH